MLRIATLKSYKQFLNNLKSTHTLLLPPPLLRLLMNRIILTVQQIKEKNDIIVESETPLTAFCPFITLLYYHYLTLVDELTIVIQGAKHKSRI